MIFFGNSVTNATGIGACLIPSAAILLFIWYWILSEHSKSPLSRKVMTMLIACTVFIVAMFPLGLLSLAFWISTYFLVFPFIFGINKLFSHLLYKRCSAYTEGIISDIRQVKVRRTCGAVSCYYPTVSFHVDGVQYNVELSSLCEPDDLGNTCWIRYNPNDPNEITQEQYEKGADKLISVLSVILLCVALFFIIGGITDIVYLLRQ